MTEVLLLVLAIVSIIMALVTAKICSGRTAALGPLLLYVACSILFINIGFIKYFLTYRVQSWAADALFSISLGLFMVAVGGFVGGLIFKTPITWPNITRVQLESDIPYPIAMSTALVIFSLVLLYFYFLGYIPLIEGIRTLVTEGFRPGLTNTFRVGRDIYVNPEATYIPMQGFMEAMRYFGLPIVAIWFLHYFRMGIKKKLSMLMVITAVVLIISTGQRWPLMYMILSLIIYRSWTEPNPQRFRRFLVITVAMAAIAGIFLSALLGRATMYGLNLYQMLVFGIEDLANRILFGNARIPFFSYQMFSMDHNWLYGWSWLQNLISYLPGPDPSYPVTFYQLVTGNQKGFTAPPDFYTEAYINFGWLGVIVVPFFWGMGLASFQSMVVKPNTGLLRLSISVILTVLVSFSAMSGAVFIFGGIIISLFIFDFTA